jgi:hypothetical protein
VFNRADSFQSKLHFITADMVVKPPCTPKESEARQLGYEVKAPAPAPASGPFLERV